MTTQEELHNHITSIGQWASEDNKRVAFVICGEMTDTGIKTANSLVGRTDRIARAVYGNTQESKDFKQIIDLVSKMLDNPLIAAIISHEASKDETSSKTSGGIADSFIGLLDALTDKLRKSDTSTPPPRR